MSTFSEKLAGKREITCMELELGQRAPLIRFCPWLQTEWILSWSHLDAVSVSREEALERLDLFFYHRRVVIAGENLQKIVEELPSSRISCLRQLPETYRPTLGPTNLFINRLEIGPL